MSPLFSRPDSEYDRQIRRVLRELETAEPGSDQYGTLVDRLNKLQKMRAEDRPEQLSPNTLALIGANLVGMLLVVRHEQFNVITSKAIAMVMRTK